MEFDEFYSCPARNREEAEANLSMISQICYLARMSEKVGIGKILYEELWRISRKMLKFITIDSLQDCRRYLSLEEMEKTRKEAEDSLAKEIAQAVLDDLGDRLNESSSGK